MCLLVVPWVSFNRFTSICVIDRRQSCVTHPGAALRSGGCSLVSLGGLVILHLLPDAVHLALQHVEPAVNVAGDADRTAEVSMGGLHLLLQKAHIVSQHLNMPAQQGVAAMSIMHCLRLAVSGCHMTHTSLSIMIILVLPVLDCRTACSMG